MVLLGMSMYLSAAVASTQVTFDLEAESSRLQVTLAAAFPGPTDPYSDVLTSTGDAVLDKVLLSESVSEVRRVFRRPPRGWRSEVAARAAGLDRHIVVTVGGGQDAVRLRERLGECPGVVHCSGVQRVVAGDTIPDDPDFGNQWALQKAILNAPKAWDKRRESTHVVAVIDTGAHLNHSDLKDNIWVNPGEIAKNGIDDDNNGFIDDDRGWDFHNDDNRPKDDNGHGTHISGIIGAETDNNHLVSGVCWKVPVMQVKGLGRFTAGTSDKLAAGMVYAVDNGASVLNMSWGAGAPDPFFEAAIAYATSLDTVLVAAAMNFDSSGPWYPAAYPEVMAVIATDASDDKASFSNYGDWCDLAAPGDEILSLGLNDTSMTLSGTSMATPHVAAAAALVHEINPSLDAVDVRWVLNHSAKDLGIEGFDDRFGWGRIDLPRALEKAQMLSISMNSAAPGDAVSLSLHQEGAAGFTHLLLVSRFGRAPGTPVAGFDPADPRWVPLNDDSALWPYLLRNPDGGGIFTRFFDSFDGQGQSTATLQIPPGLVFSGVELSFSFVSVDPNDLSAISEVSGSTKLTIQ